MDSFHELRANTKETNLLRSRKISSWTSLLDFLRDLPYGRISESASLSQVIIQQKGTCSSKHALAKLIADQNGIEDVDLMLCFYKMNTQNTPGIGDHLSQSGLSYIPEAHCYLKKLEKRIDITKPSSDLRKIEADIIQEESILPSEVGAIKVAKHKLFLDHWKTSEKIEMGLEELWSIREKCIASLSQ